MNLSKITVSLLAGVALALFGCTQTKTTEAGTEQPATDTVTTIETIETAINTFITDSIAANYEPAELTIPCVHIVATDTTDTTDIRVWGNFYVFNYNIAGDTLKTVSGGSYPGLIHIRKTGANYAVTAFDRVEDGSNYLPSAKRIFGDKLDAFEKITSNDSLREEQRAAMIADHVKRNGLSVKLYQDYGWPARPIPAK